MEQTTRPNGGKVDPALLEKLRSVLDYDRDTGNFRWRVPVGRNGMVRRGDVAGWITDKGYVCIRVDGITRPAHRLAWLFVHGMWPSGDVDHIDGNRSHNAITNLRDVSRSINCQNAKRARKQNRSGLLGVSKKRPGRWCAQIQVPGLRSKHLGYFNTPEAAHAAYLEAKRALHGGNTL